MKKQRETIFGFELPYSVKAEDLTIRELVMLKHGDLPLRIKWAFDSESINNHLKSTDEH